MALLSASILTIACPFMFMFSKIAKAREAATIANAVEPRAESAYYDQSSDSEALLRSADRIIINLKSGATFSFPPELAQGLAGASPEDLAEVEVTPSGDGLHWEKLDADFSVPALLAGVFGTAAWMAQIKMKAS
ncbi:DUF2442 domain-containing protein [Allocoleopsis franciscana]|uniref:DUF2442 domain-containing protein n=1 Tax=Allocoleopsis franciscana PCC 7113 TaxID=1173027 RepID=K9WKB5_9CYAN|nr:DUF2442 domain-containing protein [Allocoleopsis franciscana]AFZ20613.1 Protein of unknown function (DUF3532) [Allocoleopsis franciscana PCC 7113]